MITDIEPFEARLDDVSIYAHKVQVNLFYEVIKEDSDRLSAYTDVLHYYTVTHEFQQGKSIVGDVIVMFRNQGENFDLCLFLITTISASSPVDNSGRSVFNKLIQYLFEWANKYVKENNIRDTNNKPFIMPPFGYSPDMFKEIED